MLEVLLNEAPSSFINNKLEPVRVLGQIEGYHIAVNNLMAFGVLAEDAMPIEADFSDDNNLTHETK